MWLLFTVFFSSFSELGPAKPCLVLDDARERFGLHICDNLSVYDRSAAFPMADWSKSSPDDAAVLLKSAREPYSVNFGVFCFFVRRVIDYFQRVFFNEARD